jgi:hypothetical protein
VPVHSGRKTTLVVRVMVESLSERTPLEGKTKGVQWRDHDAVVSVGGAQSCRAEIGPSCDIADRDSIDWFASLALRAELRVQR